MNESPVWELPYIRRVCSLEGADRRRGDALVMLMSARLLSPRHLVQAAAIGVSKTQYGVCILPYIVGRLCYVFILLKIAEHGIISGHTRKKCLQNIFVS
jgi:hypothetical protein